MTYTTSENIVNTSKNHYKSEANIRAVIVIEKASINRCRKLFSKSMRISKRITTCYNVFDIKNKNTICNDCHAKELRAANFNSTITDT